MLEIETATLDTFETQTSDQVRLYIKVFNQWKQEQKVPYTWDTIISSLEAVNENETAACGILYSGHYYVIVYTVISIKLLCVPRVNQLYNYHQLT